LLALRLRAPLRRAARVSAPPAREGHESGAAARVRAQRVTRELDLHDVGGRECGVAVGGQIAVEVRDERACSGRVAVLRRAPRPAGRSRWFPCNRSPVVGLDESEVGHRVDRGEEALAAGDGHQIDDRIERCAAGAGRSEDAGSAPECASSPRRRRGPLHCRWVGGARPCRRRRRTRPRRVRGRGATRG